MYSARAQLVNQWFAAVLIAIFVVALKINVGVPPNVIVGADRGAKCKVDLTHQWNFWPLMPLTLPEARVQIGLLPKLAS